MSGYLAQWMYSGLLGDDPADFTAAFVRGLGWAIMGLGIGVAVGLIQPKEENLVLFPRRFGRSLCWRLLIQLCLQGDS